MKFLDTSEFEEQSVQFDFKGKNYVLKEASGDSERRFTNARTKSAKINGSGEITELGDIGDLKPLLVHLCTFEADGPSAGKRVELSVISKWPGRLVTKLFETAKEISGFEEEDKLGEELATALIQENAPITLESFREFINTLPDTEFNNLKKLVAPSMEEQAGNLRKAIQDGSE